MSKRSLCFSPLKCYKSRTKKPMPFSLFLMRPPCAARALWDRQSPSIMPYMWQCITHNRPVRDCALRRASAAFAVGLMLAMPMYAVALPASLAGGDADTAFECSYLDSLSTSYVLPANTSRGIHLPVTCAAFCTDRTAFGSAGASMRYPGDRAHTPCTCDSRSTLVLKHQLQV